MKNLTCKNCGGTMVLDPSAITAVCQYCGTSYVLNHEDTDYYRDFYLQMFRFLEGGHDERTRRKNAEALWKNADAKQFQCSDGRMIEVRYLHTVSGKAADVYVSRSNIIFHMHGDSTHTAESYRRMVSLLDYPSADVRSLSDFFPRVTGGFQLSDGTQLLVIAKDEDEYPLCLFGELSPRHTAWIISRLENICCVLEYSGLVHPNISLDTVFINPYTHQACLYGDWWDVVKKNTYSADGTHIARTSENLVGLRRTAAQLLDFPTLSAVRHTDSVPKALIDFLTGIPADTAYEDFAVWDATIEKAFGGRKFIRMDTDDEQIYKRKV